MEVKLRFRFNKKSGQVEQFQVDDLGGEYLPVEEHDRLHDQIAADLGRVLERHPRVSEIPPAVGPSQGRNQHATPSPDQDETRDQGTDQTRTRRKI